MYVGKRGGVKGKRNAILRGFKNKHNPPDGITYDVLVTTYAGKRRIMLDHLSDYSTPIIVVTSL